MTDVLTLPLLSLPDLVVLPGMVVPVELDADSRPVVDAAQAAATAEPATLLLAPRLADRYPTHGVVATIEQVGRLPGGEPRRRAARRRRGRASAPASPAPARPSGSRPRPSRTAAVTDARARARPRSTSGWSSRSCSGATPGR